MSTLFTLVATCSLGLEAVVGRELRDLGCDGVQVDNGNVSFSGTLEAIPRANLWLRAADRLWLRLGESFPASTFEELFEGVRALPWPELLPRDARFPVDGHSHGSKLESVPAIQKIAKKAVVEALKRRYRTEWFEETGASFAVRAAVVHDRCTVTVDTSGAGLHRRGYRVLTAPAPLRETLAAGLVLLSYWKPDRVLVDPFCGSGTIPIEAAMIGLRRAPGLRREFASEGWALVGRKRWEEARREAEEAFDRTTTLQILGYDVDPEVLRMARHHLRQAGLEERGIHFQQQAVADLRSSRKYGVIITNPPYGERMLEREEAERAYRELGEVTRALGTWSLYVLSSHPEFEKHLRQPVTRKRKLYNGMLQCTYHQIPGPRPPRG